MATTPPGPVPASREAPAIPLRTDASPPAIALTAATKRYGAVTAVDGIDLVVDPGETVALLGPNGAGKSTTVGMLLGLLAPDSGAVRVGGRRPRQAVARGLIAAMLQDTGMMPGVTVRELVGLGARSYPDPMPVAEALDLAGLSELARRRVDRLSGGQAQRLRAALAVVGRPPVLLLDEPTRALDVAGRRDFWAAMREYAAAGRTVLFATHHLDEVEANAGRVVVIVRGTVVADGSPAHIRALAGAATIRLSTGSPPADLRRLPGVTGVEVNGEQATIRTTDPDATVTALATGGLRWRDIAVLPNSLDDSFLILTGENR